MFRKACRYSLNFGESEITFEEASVTLKMCVLAAKSLHGESQFFLDSPFYIEHSSGTFLIDMESKTGRDLNLLFIGFLKKEFGPNSFSIGHEREEQ